MRKLSDTIARLAAMRTQYASIAAGSGAPDRLSPLDDFGSNPGTLKAKFFVPEKLPAGAPLVVVLHGCTQNAAEYDYRSGWSRLADTEGFALLYPEQQRANNANLCFNWFVPSDITRDSGEVLSIRQMIEAISVAHGLDRKRVYVTGLSAGGAMAAAMLATYPELFAGGAIIAGLPYGAARTVPEAFDPMRGHGLPSERDLQRLLSGASPHSGPWPRLSIWQGSGDGTVAASNADAIAAQWRGVHKLSQAAGHSETTGIHSRQAWQAPAGDTVLEINTIAGMGHGTPLGHGLGVPGPYMLDVGISSTREISRFWGVADAAGKQIVAQPAAAAQKGKMPATTRIPAEEKTKRNSSEPQGAKSRAAAANGQGVKTIIEDALRAAGLMR